MIKQIAMGILVFLAVFLYLQNNWLKVTQYVVKIEGSTNSNSSCKIVHLSDIHNKKFGSDHQMLVDAVSSQKPDFIAITGDLIDRRRYNKQNAISLVEKLVTIAPVYYVTGNHEWWSGDYENLKKDIEKTGVNILSNEVEVIQHNNLKIRLIGVDDPAKYYRSSAESAGGYYTLERVLDNLLTESETADATVLLSHRPELFDMYKEKEMDVVLSGHAHGGQVRIPFAGGLFSPNQGLFPEFDAGLYVADGTHLIVNRGLGNSIVPLRVFNRPEVGVIMLNFE